MAIKAKINQAHANNNLGENTRRFISFEPKQKENNKMKKQTKILKALANQYRFQILTELTNDEKNVTAINLKVKV